MPSDMSGGKVQPLTNDSEGARITHLPARRVIAKSSEPTQKSPGGQGLRQKLLSRHGGTRAGAGRLRTGRKPGVGKPERVKCWKLIKTVLKFNPACCD